MSCYIDRTTNFEVIGKYYDPIKALEELRNKKIDVVFCDIEMPDINGLQLLESLSLHQPHNMLVVIVSAHEKYAIDGFNINAIDFLLKPVSFARYLMTTQKILHYIKDDEKSKNKYERIVGPEPQASKDYFFIKLNSKLLKINYNEILYIESIGDYVKIHLENPNKSVLILDSLKHLEKKLAQNFLRIHRSYIVSVSKIRAIEYKKAIISDKLSLPISNSYYNSLYEALILTNIIK